MSLATFVMDKFGSIYGSQKVGAMWAGADLDAVIEDWNRQLSRVSVEAIGGALQTLVDTGSQWPPTMGEFIALCKRPTVPAHKPALPLPDRTAEQIAEGAKRVSELLSTAQLGARDPMLWAKRPMSPKAVEFLRHGATKDSRLRDILDAHIADGGQQCRTEAARRALMGDRA